VKAIREVSICYGHLDQMLKMTIKTLAGFSVDEALDASERATAAVLRERVHKLARQRLGEGIALLKLEAILERCRRASASRNEIIHNVPPVLTDRERIAEQMLRLARSKRADRTREDDRVCDRTLEERDSRRWHDAL
jgi:hypothetical protein